MTKNTIEGIDVLVEQADHYLQIDDIGAAEIRKVWRQIEANYPGYDKWLCYHNTEAPLALLEKLGAALIDDCIEMRLTARAVLQAETSGVVRVTQDFFDEFAAYHDGCNPEVYWTSQRIGRDLSRWGIFALRADGGFAGYVLLSLWDSQEAEVFCIEASSDDQYKALLHSAAQFAFDSGKREVLYMADADSAAQKAAVDAGFAVTGFYKGYRVKGRSKAFTSSFPCTPP